MITVITKHTDDKISFKLVKEHTPSPSSLHGSGKKEERFVCYDNRSVVKTWVKFSLSEEDLDSLKKVSKYIDDPDFVLKSLHVSYNKYRGLEIMDENNTYFAISENDDVLEFIEFMKL